jgi:hypothetical protein
MKRSVLPLAATSVLMLASCVKIPQRDDQPRHRAGDTRDRSALNHEKYPVRRALHF